MLALLELSKNSSGILFFALDLHRDGKPPR
jgi:hypothetical protein